MYNKQIHLFLSTTMWEEFLSHCNMSLKWGCHVSRGPFRGFFGLIGLRGIQLRGIVLGQPSQPIDWPWVLELRCNFLNCKLKVCMTNSSKDNSILLLYVGLALSNFIFGPLQLNEFWSWMIFSSLRGASGRGLFSYLFKTLPF